MENFTTTDWELKNVVKELSQGRELAMQLQNHLNVPSSSHETREFLLHKILYSYDQALSMLKHSRPGDGGSGDAPPPGANLDSPASLAGSPRSDDDSDQDNFKDIQASRKRKAVPRWTQKVNVSPGTGIEGQFDDGYAWRKYGQKDILGAKHPRGYYRCTHRHGQGCLATKQVQRSDEDPNIFEITYRRKHTCTPRANPNNNNNNNPLIPQPDPQNEDSNPLAQNPHQFVEGPSQQNQPHEPPFNIQTSLRVITQDLGTNENPSFHPFNFPPSPTIKPDNNHNIISSSNNILENYSPNYSNYFPISTNFTNDNYGDLIPNLHISESELSPIVAAMNISSTNSSTIGTHFQFGPSEFGSEFGFGNPGYYP